MKPRVSFDNRAEVAAWLSALRSRIDDLEGIAGAALKPKSERVVSRAELRRELDVASSELHRLCRAGERGVRNPPRNGGA